MYFSSIVYNSTNINSICIRRFIKNSELSNFVLDMDFYKFTLYSYNRDASILIEGKERTIGWFLDCIVEQYDEIYNLCRQKERCGGVNDWQEIYHLFTPSKLDLEFRTCLDIKQISAVDNAFYIKDLCNTFIQFDGVSHSWLNYFDRFVLGDKVLYFKSNGWGRVKYYKVEVVNLDKYDAVMAKKRFIESR